MELLISEIIAQVLGKTCVEIYMMHCKRQLLFYEVNYLTKNGILFRPKWPGLTSSEQDKVDYSWHAPCEKRFLEVVTSKTGFWVTISANNLKKITFYLSRITSNIFSHKLATELESKNCIKFADIFAEVMRVIRRMKCKLLA